MQNGGTHHTSWCLTISCCGTFHQSKTFKAFHPLGQFFIQNSNWTLFTPTTLDTSSSHTQTI
jgi:hypothetical protein